MEKISSLGKGGWHPQKTGSIRGDIKSWVGRGDGGQAQARERAEAHNSTPLSALKDPSSFAPPPKHTGFYPTNNGETVAESSQSPVASTSTVSRALPVRSGAASTPANQQATEEEAPRSGPFVVDTTGLSTAHLPKPPVKRMGTLPLSTPVPPVNHRSSTALASASTDPASVAKVKKSGPPLPPRLPPRSAVAGNNPPTPTSPPPSYLLATASSLSAATSRSDQTQQAGNLLNQDAIGRLGAAGISVPGFGIASKPSTPATLPKNEDDNNSAANTSELQSRFAALGSAAVSGRAGNSDGLAALATKKKPVLPVTKPALSDNARVSLPSTQDDKPQPPPVPLSTKPR